MNKQKFKLHLIEGNEDFVVTTHRSCLKCLKNKGGYTLIKTVNISESYLKEIVFDHKYGIWRPKILDVKCICYQKKK